MALNSRTKTPGVLWRVGVGAPAAGFGGENDCYRDLVTGLDYEKIGGAWGLIIQAQLPATKITGTIVDSQISGMSASKLSGLVPLANIPNNIPTSDISGLNKFTVGTSFPGSPADGDEHLLVDSTTAPTWAMTFRYVASITDAFKWVSKGGPGIYAHDGSGTARANTASSTWQYIPGNPFVTLPRAGYWRFRVGASVYSSSANFSYISSGLVPSTGSVQTATSVNLPYGQSYTSVAGDTQYDMASSTADDLKQGITRSAGQIIALVMDSGLFSGTGLILGWIEAIPMRCS